MQRSRRTNPYPFQWEIPLALVAGAALALVLGAHMARTLANLAAGNGLVFTPRAALFTSLPGLLSGHAAAGLGHLTRPASPTTLWTCLTLVEVVTVVAMGVAMKAGLNRWGPGRMRGMATRAEAERLLGRRRLHTVASVVRPDLYGRAGPRP